MSATGKLFSHKEPYAVASTEELFIRAMRENCAFHYGRNETYRHILDEAGFSPEQLKAEEDLARLPVLPTLYFKRHTLFTLPERRLIAKVTSSGTGGKKSHVGFDLKTLWRELNMVLGICKYHRLWSAKPTRYVIFGYRPRKNSLGAAKSAFAFTLLAPAISRVYALESSESGIRLDMDGLKKRLIRYAKGKLPVRTMGFPAYTYFLLRQMKEEGISAAAGSNSMPSAWRKRTSTNSPMRCSGWTRATSSSSSAPSSIPSSTLTAVRIIFMCPSMRGSSSATWIPLRPSAMNERGS